MKQCKKCGELKPVDDFYRQKSYPDGRMSICKKCKNTKRKQWDANNPERSRERKRAYQTEYLRKWHADRPDYRKLWHINNPMYNRISSGAYRAKQLGQLPTPFSEEDLLNYWRDNGISASSCFYTGEPLGSDWHLDHMTPLSRGGQHVLSNLVPCTAAVNLDKGSKTAEEYLAEVREVVA